MTENELQKIEDRIGCRLPSFYRDTLLSYPFEQNSFAEEFMLPNCPQALIDLNESGLLQQTVPQPFIVGSDGGEETYFIDMSEQEEGVFVFDLETGMHNKIHPTWTSYLENILATEREIAADEKNEQERQSKKKWWKLW